MHKTIVAAAAVLLTVAGVCLAQPPGITPEMISRSLPLEGAPLAEPGPYKITSEAAFGSPGLHVYRPEALEAFPKKDTLPVMSGATAVARSTARATRASSLRSPRTASW
jgi:hypothetical protein